MMLPRLNDIINVTCKERGIDRDLMIGVLTRELEKEAKEKFGLEVWGDYMVIDAMYNEELGEIELYHYKTVTENAIDTIREISIDDAQLIVPDAELGEQIGTAIDVKQFGHIIAYTVRWVLRTAVGDQS
jgi:transcription termination/antitermination protein NusA